MTALRTRCVDGIAAERGARARAARPQHRDRHRAQPVHRLRGDRGDREGIGQDRTADSRARARTRLAGREAARRDPLGGGDDQAGHRRGGRTSNCGEAAIRPDARGDRLDRRDASCQLSHCAGLHPARACVMPRLGSTRSRPGMAAGARESPALLPMVPPAVKAQERPRLFPAQDLGLLEAPDRDEWQKPDQIMDALEDRRRLGRSPTSAPAAAGSRSGWRAASARTAWSTPKTSKPQMIEVIGRRVQRENLRSVKPVLGTATDPRLPPRLDAVLIVDAYHEMDDPARPKDIVTLLRERRAVAQATGPPRRRRLPAGQTAARDRRRRNASIPRR